MKKIKFSNEELARADWCESPTGDLYSGGYAMVHGKNYSHPDPRLGLEGRVVFLVKADADGFWDCYDKAGDLLIILDENLLPLSDKEKDDGSDEVKRFQYEARFGS